MQLILGRLPTPKDMVDTILSFCFYDAALREERYRGNRETLMRELKEVTVSYTMRRAKMSSVSVSKIPRKKIPGMYGTILWGTTKNTTRDICTVC